MLNAIKLSINILILFTVQAQAEPVKIAVIDTGYTFEAQDSIFKQVRLEANMRAHGLKKPIICDNGTYNMIDGTTDTKDNHGHGTHIASLIAKHVEVDYCLIIIKFFDPNSAGNNLKNTIKAFRKAIDLKVDYINYSGGGLEYSKEEEAVVVEALDKGIQIIAAAGNERTCIEYNKYYPAMYDIRIKVVGNIDKNGRTVSSSNYSCTGLINYHEQVGWEVMGLDNGAVRPMSGTSQATAVFTGKYVNFWEKIKKAIRKGLIK